MPSPTRHIPYPSTSPSAFREAVQIFIMFGVAYGLAPILWFSTVDFFVSENHEAWAAVKSLGGFLTPLVIWAAYGTFNRHHWFNTDTMQRIGLTSQLSFLSLMSPCVMSSLGIVVLSLVVQWLMPVSLDQHATSPIVLQSLPVLSCIYVLGLVFAYPLLEEVLFRGIIQNRLFGHYSLWLANGITSLWFTLAHHQVYTQTSALLMLFILSVYLGWIRAIQTSLWPCIVAHSVINAWCVITLFY